MDRTRASLWLDESNVIFRRGMASCLTAAAFDVVGESSHLSPVPDLEHTSVLIVELDGPGLSGAARLAGGRAVRLVGPAGTSSGSLVRDAVQSGFAGLLLRANLTPEGLVAAVHAVVTGSGSIPPPLLARLVDDLGRVAVPRAGRGSLARRELDVLRLLADGGTTREIAEVLCYSERTVKNIVHDSLAKLNCRSRAQAVAVVARQGVI